MMHAETRIQCSIVQWWNYAAGGFGIDARLLCHVPNGGKRSKTEARIFKGMAVRAGWPDLQLLVPRGEKHGLFVEVKSPDGRISPEQKQLIPLLEAQNYAVCVAWNVDEGINAITNYLRSGHPLIKL